MITEKISYAVCMNDRCDVVYFSREPAILYRAYQIRVPLWFKKGSDPKFACYCNRVTEKQVVDAVLQMGAKSLKDVVRITSAMKNGSCVTENPLGICCGARIQKIVENTLEG